ncbi:ras-related GTP-binding protein A isoform X2 [Petaurus breviceps papuanus]|uniref:ras-related GTP-binding protein A isoform X2 n=1 Tax=Petaurus breviceps papuanus TaxID=3040969 RepID=UPI0036D76CAB
MGAGPAEAARGRRYLKGQQAPPELSADEGGGGDTGDGSGDTAPGTGGASGSTGTGGTGTGGTGTAAGGCGLLLLREGADGSGGGGGGAGGGGGGGGGEEGGGGGDCVGDGDGEADGDTLAFPMHTLWWVMPITAMKKKVLLMGKSGSGKTSMRSIIFANYIARDTRRLGATIDVEHSHVRFLGNLVLNLWDCGGQDTFMENYFTSQRDNIFRNVEVLIYVFDVESRELEKDMHYYQSCLEAILQNSPDAKIFCLVHKMDLVQEDQRDLIFKEREEDLRRLSRPLECACFRTSIWDETLYKAWSSIVYQLIPNVQQLEMNLRNFAQIIEADEVLLFERATFLVISHYQCKEQRDVHRFEKISNIIKQFKLSCSKLAASFQSMEVRNSNFAAFIDIFTSNTYVMVVMSDPSIPSAATLINIRNARKHFEKLERVDGPKHSLLMR